MQKEVSLFQNHGPNPNTFPSSIGCELSYQARWQEKVDVDPLKKCCSLDKPGPTSIYSESIHVEKTLSQVIPTGYQMIDIPIFSGYVHSIDWFKEKITGKSPISWEYLAGFRLRFSFKSTH